MKDPASLWRRTLQLLQAMHIPLHAAHTCYFILLAVFPTLVVLFGLLRYTALQPEDLLDFFSGLLPDALLPYAWDVLCSAYTHASGQVISLSALAALWSAGRGIFGLQAGLNAVYGFPQQRSWLLRRLLCTAYTVLFLLVLVLTLVLHVFGNTFLLFLRQRTPLVLPGDSAGLRYFLLVTLQVLLFSSMFMYLPCRQRSFRESLPGALLSSFGWMSASSLFSLYVRYFPRYASIFGSVYTIVLAGIWLYICISIFFYGAVLNRLLMKSADFS